MEYSPQKEAEAEAEDDLLFLESRYKNMNKKQLADAAVQIAVRQIMACADFKKPRLSRIAKFWRLYDGDTPKKIRQLFNVPIPVFPGMIDTLNAQYDTPIQLKFKEGDASDYFKVEKINGAFQMEVNDTSENTKWVSKFRMTRKHAIMTGRGIIRYTAESDPEYKSTIDNVNLKNFIFQPRGGISLENHLFSGEEDIQKTRHELIKGVKAGVYEKEWVKQLIQRCENKDYIPEVNSNDLSDKLSRFKPLGLDPDNNSFVGESVYKLVNHILQIDGERYYLCFDPWSLTPIAFEKWSEMNSSGLYPWDSYATHEDDENFLSKSYADDLYPAADAIVAMFNQELTNREKRNFGARAYDKDMFTDVRKLDDAMHRPDALVPADTKNGTRRISEGIYEFKVGDLGGTVNLIDWVTGSLGRNTGANDLSMGSVQEVSKKASVTFAEQKSISKRIGWASEPFHEMLASIGKKYIWGLKDHMPSRMAIRVLGPTGWDWDQISRMDLDTTKDIDVIITSTDKQNIDNEMKKAQRKEALAALAGSPNVNARWRDEETLRSIGGYDDVQIAQAMDVKSYTDKKSMAHADEAIQLIELGKKTVIWYGATPAFMQRIVDYATDNRATLKDKYFTMIDYAMAHTDFARENVARQAREDARLMASSQMSQGNSLEGTTEPAISSPTMGTAPISPGVKRAMTIGAAA